MTFDQLWDLLLWVRAISFVARSEAETGWNGRGVGEILFEQSNRASPQWPTRARESP